MSSARYDGISEWYDATCAGSPFTTDLALRLLGGDRGRLVDVGCGTGAHTAAFSSSGWDTTGVDISADQLRLARERGVDVVQADATELPFGDATFDAAVSMWTHTDIDDFAGALGEIARVLRPNGAFVYVGGQPCFVGPHSLFAGAQGVPELYPGYRDAGRYSNAPGVVADGLRAKVGAVHRPLGELIQSFLDAGFALEQFEEASHDEYPFVVALRCRR
ncbi:MAG: class I SAM-dependent methyltransferase [Thermoleophilia bacterium]